MRFQFTTLAVCWMLAACSVGASDNSPQAQCARQAENDPAVVAIYTRTNGAYTQDQLLRDDLIFARRQATLRCMREKGLAPPGGVQPVQIR